MNAQNIRPPKALEKLLSWVCKGELLEEILGDLEEYHYELLAQPRWKRRLFYWFQVLNFLRPFALRGIAANHRFNHTVMFRNYFKTSLRSLLKSPLSSFINVFGLAAAIGICVLVYGFAQWTYRTDQFHANKNEVYLATFFANRDGDSQQHGQTPRPIGIMLKEDFSQVEKVCRVEDRNVVLKYGDRVFHEQVRLTDPTFLEMFTFPLKWGVAGSLSDVNSIILSEEMSVKYFGEENPVGQNLLVIFGKNNNKTFTVAGVAAEFPASRTVDFGFLIHFDNNRVADAAFDLNDWGAFVNATFVQVSNAIEVKAIEEQMGKYQQLQNAAVQEDWAITSFAFEPLATLHERSEFIKDDISWSSASNYSSVIYLSVVGILLLALACFNYINIAIVSSAKRLKEIGIRKTIGAHKGVVVVQFLAENLVVTFFALVLGLALGMVIFIPGFEQMWHFSMGFSLTDPKLFIYLGAVLFFTAAASGVYPAFYISKFEVVRILKGTVQFGKKNPLTKILLCIQLVIACILITSAVMFTQNTSYLAKRSWGYQPREALYAQIPDVAAFDQLQAAMAQNPNIVSQAGSADHLGRQSGNVVVRTPDRQYEVDRMRIDANYFATMGVEIKEGRNFKDNYESDKQAVIVNEALVAALSQGEPLGQMFKIDSTQYEIIGVVGEVHHRSFFNTIRPTIYTVAERDDFRYLSMKVRPGSEKETYQALQDNWAALFPEVPFQGGFQENVWGNYYEEIGIHATVWQVFAFIAISMASLGLYGLIRLNVAGRIREFSIRKVLGANLGHLAANITSQYKVLFVAALIAGAPVSYFLVKLIITTSYEYHMPITYSGVALAVGILVTVLVATVSTQVKTVSKANPAKGLRVE